MVQLTGQHCPDAGNVLPAQFGLTAYALDGALTLVFLAGFVKWYTNATIVIELHWFSF